ncbi:MAG: AAA family ATPase [Chitinophagales bacterium]
MDHLNQQHVINASNVFDKRYLDIKTLYLYYFNALPSLCFISKVEGEKAYAAFADRLKDQIVHIYQYRWYERKKRKYQFDRTVIILKSHCLLELDEDYAQILHDGNQPGFVDEITSLLGQFKKRQRRRPLEINLVVENSGMLDLKAMEIKRTKLDLDLFYEDDFREVDEVIRKRLNRKKDKGIVLLHGLPRAGKTTYLRHLIGKINKKVLFLSSAVAGNLMNPEFIELIMDNQNTVLIVEDAENIIMDRKFSPGSAVSNLLDISDGLLSDFLNVQLICTFNNSLELIDPALMRKGRLIAKYEFGKLNISKAQRLSDHLGFKTKIMKPMTVAEIANQHEKDQREGRIEVMGFRRALMEN